MDKIPVDFLSLPDDFKLQIFRELDSRSFKNLKLVCREFCLFIEKDIKSLDRSKVYFMSLYYDEVKISSGSYYLMDTEDPWRYGPLKFAEFSNDNEYEKFLKNIDFTEIRQLYLCNLSNIESITVDYENDSSENFSAYNFSARLPNRRFHCSYLSIKIEKSRKFGKRYDGNLLRKETLRKLGILGKNGLRSVRNKIAMDLLIGNPMLKYEHVPTDARKPLYIQITNHLIKLEFSNLENTCGRKRFTLIFRDVYKFVVLRKKFYRKLFSKIKPNINLVEKNNDDEYSIKSSMKCSKCGFKHENSIFYSRDSEELYIQLL